MARPRQLTDATAFALRRMTALGVTLLVAVSLAGCGEESEKREPAAIALIKSSAGADAASFPQADGRKTFDDIIKEADAMDSDQTSLLPAANNFVAGRENRVPFGLFEFDRTSVWGPTVVYTAGDARSPAKGPFVPTVHAYDVPAKYRSKTSSSDYDHIGSGFFTFNVRAGRDQRKVSLLTLTRTDGAVRSAYTTLKLADDDPSPAPGELAPRVATPTLDDVNGDASKIDTRVPPSRMHDVSLDDALKERKPVVLVFATTALCASRVCGPVVDVASQVQDDVGDAAIFVHMEIYNDNDPNKGYRSQVGSYGLTSEPFTFVIGADGRVVAQLQGPFVASELKAALREAGA